MKSDIEIFDKNGKALDIADVIGRFLFEQGEIHNLKYKERDITIGIDGKQSKPKLVVYNVNYDILDSVLLNDL